MRNVLLVSASFLPSNFFIKPVVTQPTEQNVDHIISSENSVLYVMHNSIVTQSNFSVRLRIVSSFISTTGKNFHGTILPKSNGIRALIHNLDCRERFFEKNQSDD